MNHRILKLISNASVAALALALGPATFGQRSTSSSQTESQAQDQSASSQNGRSSSAASDYESSATPSASASSSSTQTAQVRIASRNDRDRTAEKLSGAKLRSSDGKDLGDIKDFLIDARSGKVCFAVVSTGGVFGIGDRLHVVPFDVLQEAGNRSFTVSTTEAQWKQGPTINEESFEENRLSLDPQVRDQIAQTFSGSQVKPSSDELLRASKIRGREVVANDQKIGKIDGLVLQSGQLRASALFDPDNEFIGTEQKFIVPLDRLSLSTGGEDKVTTSLTRDDFRNAARSNTAGSTASNTTEQSQNVAAGAQSDTSTSSSSAVATQSTSLSPTGSTSNDQNVSASKNLVGQARAIRQALDDDPATAQANVTVTPGNNKIMLEGTVKDEPTKSEIEQIARRTAQGADVDSKLSIENRNQ